MLRRKIDDYLLSWKQKKGKKPLILSGARQTGKTTAIQKLGKTYKSYVEINFLTSPQYRKIIDNGYDSDEIVKQISFINPHFKFIEGDTLILFDEIQAIPDLVTSLKSFSISGKYDVICSGSLLGVNYKSISSIPVGYKEDYNLSSMDFEEFLWAKGYSDKQIDDIYSYMKDLKPLPSSYYDVLSKLFKEYIFVGGMPEAVQSFINEGTYSLPFEINKRIYRDYEDDIIKYVEGLDSARVKNLYRHISSQLAKDNHKFQITKLSHGARSRDYKGIKEWLLDAGIINIAYNLGKLELPFDLNEQSNNFRIYYSDHSLFISSLDEETRKDIINNDNYQIHSGALFESLISESLIKQGYKLYFYKNEDASIELDFVLRYKNEILPVEVKQGRGKSKSLNSIIKEKNLINYGIKFMDSNIGFNDNKFTFPYFLSFLLKRFLDNISII